MWKCHGVVCLSLIVCMFVWKLEYVYVWEHVHRDKGSWAESLPPSEGLWVKSSARRGDMRQRGHKYKQGHSLQTKERCLSCLKHAKTHLGFKLVPSRHSNKFACQTIGPHLSFKSVQDCHRWHTIFLSQQQLRATMLIKHTVPQKPGNCSIYT